MRLENDAKCQELLFIGTGIERKRKGKKKSQVSK